VPAERSAAAGTRVPDFREAYPISAKAAVHTQAVFRSGMPGLAGLPWPRLEGIRDFARFAGISDGATRTALSRAKAEGSLVVEEDSGGVKRYRLSAAQLARGNAVIRSGSRPEGFLVAVFSFKSEDTEERAALRETLKDFGFRKLAQNAYINGRIETAPLRAAVRVLGLESHLHLFTCPELDDEDQARRVLALFDLESRKRELADYLATLRAFLPDSLADDELARRLLYVGPVHFERVELGEPPIPLRYRPEAYPLDEINRFYGERLERGGALMLTYYLEMNGKE